MEQAKWYDQTILRQHPAHIKIDIGSFKLTVVMELIRSSVSIIGTNHPKSNPKLQYSKKNLKNFCSLFAIFYYHNIQFI